MLVQALVGAVIAVSLLVLIRDHDRSRRIWSFGLVVATLIYVGFAAAAGESLPRELLGVGIFLPFAAAGWRGRVPFQLRLGDRQGGVRGYGASRVVGAVRTVASLTWIVFFAFMANGPSSCKPRLSSSAI